MQAHYAEILDVMGEPKWWGERGVPRYCAFSPSETDSIYASQALLLRVQCQGCGHPFDVCLSSSAANDALDGSESLEQYVRATVLEETFVDFGGVPMRREFGYGDPPNIGCCAAGPTMTAVPLRILEFWRRDGSRDWVRCPEFELDCRPAWADDEPEGPGL